MLKNIIKFGAKNLVIFNLVFTYLWLVLLKDTESYYSIYILCGLINLSNMIITRNRCSNNIKCNISIFLCASFMALAIVFANYNLFSGIIGVIKGVICLASGINVFLGVINIIEKISINWLYNYKKIRGKVFFFAVVILLISYGFYFVTSGYPGNLDTDSFNSIRQIKSGVYSNHHPVCYTLLVRFWLYIGAVFSDDINVGVCLYSLFQMLVMVVVYSYVIETVYVLAGYIVSFVLLGWYALLPVHITYSVTMWKDIMFGIMVALFVCALLRILKQIGNKHINYVIFFIGAVGFCIFRHNGKIAYVLMLLYMFIVLKGKTEKIVTVLSFSALTVSLLLMHAGNKAVNAEEVPPVDSLSIPLQQISRVIYDGYQITDEQYNILSNVIDVDSISGLYVNYVSDPIKGAVYEYGNQYYFKTNAYDLIIVYLQIGSRHPIEYIKAWIDMTRGYWNGGYEYFKWINYVKDNEMGINKQPLSWSVSTVYQRIFRFIAGSNLLQPLIGIGIYTWIFLVVFAISVKNKNQLGVITVMPFIFILCTLLISTPLDSELRYLYAGFAYFPLAIGILVNKDRIDEEISQ